MEKPTDDFWDLLFYSSSSELDSDDEPPRRGTKRSKKAKGDDAKAASVHVSETELVSTGRPTSSFFPDLSSSEEGESDAEVAVRKTGNETENSFKSSHVQVEVTESADSLSSCTSAGKQNQLSTSVQGLEWESLSTRRPTSLSFPELSSSEQGELNTKTETAIKPGNVIDRSSSSKAVISKPSPARSEIKKSVDISSPCASAGKRNRTPVQRFVPHNFMKKEPVEKSKRKSEEQTLQEQQKQQPKKLGRGRPNKKSETNKRTRPIKCETVPKDTEWEFDPNSLIETPCMPSEVFDGLPGQVEPGEFVVEKIIDRRISKVDGVSIEYFVKWKYWSDEYNSWEPEEHMSCKKLMRQFEKSLEDWKAANTPQTPPPKAKVGHKKVKEIQKPKENNEANEISETEEIKKPREEKKQEVNKPREEDERSVRKPVIQRNLKRIESNLYTMVRILWPENKIPIKVRGAFRHRGELAYAVQCAGTSGSGEFSAENCVLVYSFAFRYKFPAILLEYLESAVILVESVEQFQRQCVAEKAAEAIFERNHLQEDSSSDEDDIDGKKHLDAFGLPKNYLCDDDIDSDDSDVIFVEIPTP